MTKCVHSRCLHSPHVESPEADQCRYRCFSGIQVGKQDCHLEAWEHVPRVKWIHPGRTWGHTSRDGRSRFEGSRDPTLLSHLETGRSREQLGPNVLVSPRKYTLTHLSRLSLFVGKWNASYQSTACAQEHKKLLSRLIQSAQPCTHEEPFVVRPCNICAAWHVKSFPFFVEMKLMMVAGLKSFWHKRRQQCSVYKRRFWCWDYCGADQLVLASASIEAATRNLTSQVCEAAGSLRTALLHWNFSRVLADDLRTGGEN